jgi:ribonuclease P protein component
MERLKRRQDFVAAAKASYAAMPGMVVQARDRKDGAPPRVGFTATKKLGNAVVRNRVKRRLREIARLHLEGQAKPGLDYVLIGRGTSLERSFADLMNDLNSALKRLHRNVQRAADDAAAGRETQGSP